MLRYCSWWYCSLRSWVEKSRDSRCYSSVPPLSNTCGSLSSSLSATSSSHIIMHSISSDSSLSSSELEESPSSLCVSIRSQELLLLYVLLWAFSFYAIKFLTSQTITFSLPSNAIFGGGLALGEGFITIVLSPVSSSLPFESYTASHYASGITSYPVIEFCLGDSSVSILFSILSFHFWARFISQAFCSLPFFPDFGVFLELGYSS